MPGSAPSTLPPKTRDHYLDSLRGIAAIVVVIAHYLAAFYPFAVFADSNRYVQHGAWESALHWPPLSLLSAGHFAVCLFFILSGYVLSFRFIGEPSQTLKIWGAVVKRPFRLGGLALFSLVLGALLWYGNALYHLPMGQATGALPWLEQFWTGAFSWATFLRDLALGKAGFEYNPPLWTIKIEVIGSFLVFGTLLVINRWGFAVRTALLMALIVLFYGRYYDGFFFGMLVANVYRRRPFTWREAGAVFWIAFALVIALAAYPYYAANALMPSLTRVTSHISMVSAALVFVLVIASPHLKVWLNLTPFIWLGKVSYAVYALHFLVLGSLSAWLTLQILPTLGHDLTALVVFAVSIAVLLPLSHVVTQWIDEPAIKLGQWVERQATSLWQRFALQQNKVEV